MTTTPTPEHPHPVTEQPPSPEDTVPQQRAPSSLEEHPEDLAEQQAATPKRRRTALIVLAAAAAVLALIAAALVAVAVFGSDSGEEAETSATEETQSVPDGETPAGLAWMESAEALGERAEALDAAAAEAEASGDDAMLVDVMRQSVALCDEALQTPPPDPEMAAVWQTIWTEYKAAFESLLEFVETANPQALEDAEYRMNAGDAAAQEWEQRFDVDLEWLTDDLEEEAVA